MTGSCICGRPVDHQGACKPGYITIRLNDFVALPAQAGQLALTLFPQTPQEAASDEGGDR